MQFFISGEIEKFEVPKLVLIPPNTVELVLANLETLNAGFIKEGYSQDERLQRLNEVAIYQMELLTDPKVVKMLKPAKK